MNTAFELWFDDEFLVKRIHEQEIYLLDLELRKLNGLPKIRYEMLKDSAKFVKWSFEHQLYRPHPSENTYEEMAQNEAQDVGVLS